eukprot:2853180-Rhodomonas_salina.1
MHLVIHFIKANPTTTPIHCRPPSYGHTRTRLQTQQCAPLVNTRTPHAKSTRTTNLLQGFFWLIRFHCRLLWALSGISAPPRMSVERVTQRACARDSSSTLDSTSTITARHHTARVCMRMR